MSFQTSPSSKLFRKIIEKISGVPYFLRSNARKKNLGKPGEVIESLPQEDRELLKQLTSDEAQKMSPSFGHLDYICDEYWEKKSEEERTTEYLSGSKFKK